MSAARTEDFRVGAHGPLVAIVDAVDRDLPDRRDAAAMARLVKVSGIEGLEEHLRDD